MAVNAKGYLNVRIQCKGSMTKHRYVTSWEENRLVEVGRNNYLPARLFTACFEYNPLLRFVIIGVKSVTLTV